PQGIANLPTKLGRPTGTVFNGSGGFVVTDGQNSGTSYFIYATEAGAIAGWAPDVNETVAIVAVDNSAAPGTGPVYTGLAIADNDQGTFLYAANFRTGTIDVFDANFQSVNRQGAFFDPKLPSGFVPFNIQTIGNSLYVAYT